MKLRNQKGVSITKPVLKALMDRQKKDNKIRLQQHPTLENFPLKSAQLDQDPGSAYNRNFVFPQD